VRRAIRPILLVALACGVFWPGLAQAEEADNYTCRSRLTRDSLAILDVWINQKIQETIDEINRRTGGGCDAACLFSGLRGRVGASYPHPVTLIPHSRFGRWINDRKDIDRCHLKFGETIYGAKAYNQVWLYPFYGRIIFVADSIRLAGRTVGLDKIDHFIREGLDHWRSIADGTSADIAASVAREMGPEKKQFAWTEYGLKGMSLTGVVAYADIAAGYFGYRFWDELLSLEQPGSYVAYDADSGRYSQRRQFTFADYVNDAWDEGINYSLFDPKLGKQVAEALKQRSLTMPVSDCRPLATLPQAALYVNPACLAARAPDRPRRAGVHSEPRWNTFTSAWTPSATSHSMWPAACGRSRRSCDTWWPKRSWLNRPVSIRSRSANTIDPISRFRPPKSFWPPSPAAPNA
jgi:hypothetical protein